MDSRLRSRLPLRSLLAVAACVPSFVCTQFVCTQFVYAQVDTGRVAGTVNDTSGAVISGASITLTNNATGVAQKVVSSASGSYVFGAVNPGTYTITAESQGFQKATTTGIEAHVQQNLTSDITLTPGNVDQTVTVTSAAPLLQSEDASVGQTITGADVNNLPLSGRNWVSLAQLSPGVTTTAGGTPGSALFVTNGVSFWQNDIRLNGINNNEEVYGGTQLGTNAVFTPPPDAIQEFKLQSGDFSAELGHSTGAVVNAVIKSGTNGLHGNFWEYIRNTAFNANDYFANNYADPAQRVRPAYHQNQFGGTVGGPVVIPKVYNGRDKTFFFFDYQGTRIVVPAHSTSYVPTLGMQNSNFTNFQDYFALANSASTPPAVDALGRKYLLATIFDPATTRTVAAGAVDPVTGLRNASGSAATVRDPFYSGGSLAGMKDFTQQQQALNVLPANRLDPNAIKLLKLYPLPTPGRETRRDNYDIFPKSTQSINQYDARIDQNFSSRDIVFGVFDYSHTVYTTPPVLPGLAEGQNFGAGNTDAPRYGITLGYTHVFSPTLTNEAHAGFNQSIQRIIPFEANTLGLPAQFGIPGVPQSPGNGGLPQINVSGLTGLGVAGYTPTLETTKVLEYSDNVTKQYQAHTFKSGVQVDDIRAGIIQPPNAKGSFTFSGKFSDVPNLSSGYNGMADLLLTPQAATVPNGISNLGGLSSYGTSNYAQTKTQRYYIGAYFQDDWKATPNLTLNLGLRWDHYTPNAEVRGRQANFIQDGGNGPSGTIYMSPQGCAVPRSASFNTLIAANNIAINCNSSNSTGDAQSYNFAPRIGFAYRPTPNTAIRGGYGIAYGALDNIGFGGTLGTNYPFSYTLGFNSPTSQSALTIPNGQTATIENALIGQNLQDPSVVNGAGIGLNGRQYLFLTPYTQTYNLTVQDQFTNHDSIQIGFVGNSGRHLDSTGSHNSPSAILPPGTSIYDATVLGHIPFPIFSANSAFQSTDGSSSYNSVQATYAHQLSLGLTVNVNYTYAKCLTNQRTISGNSPGFRAQWLPGFGINGDYGLCDTDTTHVIHGSGTYILPFGNNRTFLHSRGALVNALAGGWVTNYIVTHQSGQPFTVQCPVATSEFGCFANLVPGQSLYASHRSPKQWLNPAAFAQPAIATVIGQSGFAPLGGAPNQARGPGFSNVDFSLFKQFSLRERFQVEFRAEAFNLFNSHSFGQPTNLDFRNSSSFSQITSSRNNARLGQFALKLSY